MLPRPVPIEMPTYMKLKLSYLCKNPNVAEEYSKILGQKYKLTVINPYAILDGYLKNM